MLDLDMGLRWPTFLTGLLAGHPQLQPRLLPRLLVGFGMLVMAFGLVFRSRVAWLMTLLLAATGIVSLVFGRQTDSKFLLGYFIAIVVALLAAGRRFDRSSVTASTLFALTAVAMVLMYAAFGAYYLGNDFKPPITDLTTAFYYAIVTTSTVGYGDITPQTADAKLFTVSVIVLGVAVFATSLTAIVAPIVTRSIQDIVNRKSRPMKRENHFVVIGNTSLAINTCRELTNRGQPVTRILRGAVDSLPGDADAVVGDPGNVDILKQAGVEKAQAVLAMLDDDSDNAFIVLAVREMGSNARTLVAVNDAQHLSRIRLVQPDLVIAPQILGGELAAMIMCGEQVTSDFVMRSVLQRNLASNANAPAT